MKTLYAHIHTGVPLLYINRNTLVLEGASDASHDQAEQVVNITCIMYYYIPIDWCRESTTNQV